MPADLSRAENAGRAFALVLVDELVRHGMRHAVVAPGSRSTPIALALLENPDVTVHVRIDERSAAYLALGIAKASREVVPVLCTSGTAASYFHGAVMEADLSSIPLLVITADRPPELHGIGANQTVNQVGMYGDAVRWAPTVTAPTAHPDSVVAWRALVAEAVARGRSGPVHLNLPLRDPLIPIADPAGFPHDLNVRLAAVEPHTPQPADSTVLARHLTGVSRGVVVAGGWSTGDSAPVIEFAERAGWPVIAEPHSNARRGSMALRSTDALLRDEAFVASHRPDMVVVVGRVGLSRMLLGWLESVPHIVVSPDGHHWDVTRSAIDVITTSVSAFDVIDPGPRDHDWSTNWLTASQRVSTTLDEVLDSESGLSEPQVARDVAALVPPGGAIVVSSSMPIRDLDSLLSPRDDMTVYANRGVSGIDGFVSTAIGVATGRAAAAAPTVALCGDLSFLHDVNGLMTSGEPMPDLTFVVINNDGGGIFSLLPQGSSVEPEMFERLFGTPHGIDIAQVAVTYGVPHTLVTTADGLAAAMASYGGLRIIEVRTNRADNKALHDRLRETRLTDR